MTTDFLGENIRRLMKSQGMTVKALAGKAGISTVSLSNLLNNKVTPKTETLIKLAMQLNSSMDDLFRPGPHLQALRFRTVSSISARERALRDGIIINAATWIHDYCNLIDALDPSNSIQAPYTLETIVETRAEEIAAKVRERWHAGNDPIRDIVELVEDSGIKIWTRDFSMQKVFSFSIGQADGGPAIVLNTHANISIERQTFALAHELAHILLHPASFGPRTPENHERESSEEEQEADRFALELLLPKEAFKQEWNKNLAVPFVPRVLLIKKKYSVSYKTVLAHVADIHGTDDVYTFFYARYKATYASNLKGKREFEAMRAEWVAKQEIDSSPGGNALSGSGFISAVYRGYRAGIIPNESKLRETLQCSFESATDLAREWDRKDAFTETLI